MEDAPSEVVEDEPEDDPTTKDPWDGGKHWPGGKYAGEVVIGTMLGGELPIALAAEEILGGGEAAAAGGEAATGGGGGGGLGGMLKDFNDKPVGKLLGKVGLNIGAHDIAHTVTGATKSTVGTGSDPIEAAPIGAMRNLDNGAA